MGPSHTFCNTSIITTRHTKIRIHMVKNLSNQPMCLCQTRASSHLLWWSLRSTPQYTRSLDGHFRPLQKIVPRFLQRQAALLPFRQHLSSSGTTTSQSYQWKHTCRRLHPTRCPGDPCLSEPKLRANHRFPSPVRAAAATAIAGTAGDTEDPHPAVRRPTRPPTRTSTRRSPKPIKMVSGQ